MTTNCLNNECLNNFTVYGASGATRKVRIENTNNTGSSNAISQVYVEGTSAGDPFLRNVVGTSHSYAIGIDNSDSDKFKLTYSSDETATPSSTDTILSSDVSGRWRRPMTPLFEAYVNSGYTVTAATYEPIEIDTEVFDQGSNYNTGTYTFTCPIAGTYFFTLVTELNSINSSNTSTQYLIYHSATGGYVTRDFFNPHNIEDFGSYVTLNISLIYCAAASDTFTPYIYSADADGITANLTRFTGYLLG